MIGGLDTDGLRTDSLRRDAVLWNYTVLGEASGQVPDEIKLAHPNVGWAQAIRLRNRIVHGYWDVDLQILHDTATEDLPTMIEQLRGVLAQLEAEDMRHTTPGGWDVTDEEIDSWLEEWEAVDRAAADYLAERVPSVRDVLEGDAATWVDALAETISPTDEPAEAEIESVSAVTALQHADWLGLALGVVRRGPGGPLDAELVQADIDDLEEVDGEIEDPEGHLAVLEMALLHLTSRWQDLGVLDADQRFTERGVDGLPRALHRTWIGRD